jgi:hypothetical protein
MIKIYGAEIYQKNARKSMPVFLFVTRQGECFSETKRENVPGHSLGKMQSNVFLKISRSEKRWLWEELCKGEMTVAEE